MKDISIFLASSFELEPDRARIGNLIRQLNDMYEMRSIHLRLVKWEDVESFYNRCSKQLEYDYLIRQCNLFVGLFWHRAGEHTLHEVDVARKNLPPENILIFRKTAPFHEDHEGLEDVKHFLERFPDEAHINSEKELRGYLAKQDTIFRYETFSGLSDVLCKKIEEYCASIEVTEEEKKRALCSKALQIHVAASPEVELDVARLGDLVRYLDENSRHYCRLKMIDALPGSDMFVSICHTSAPDEFKKEIDEAIRENENPHHQGKPRLFFCMKYLENGTEMDQSLIELEDRFKSVLSHYPDRYANAPEMKLHFMLQLERLQREGTHSNAMLVVKDDAICQKIGETEHPLMSCEDMMSLRKDTSYQEMKLSLLELDRELNDLKKRDRETEQDLSKEIHQCYQRITGIEERIREKLNGYLKLARTLEEMVGQEQDEMVRHIRELFQAGEIDRALELLPAPEDQRREREERKRRHEAEDLRAYQVCKLTIDCLQAGNALKNRERIIDLYELLIDLADDLRSDEKMDEACFKSAECLNDFGFYDKALEHYGMSLNLRLRSFGEDDPEVEPCYRNIGIVCLNKNDYDKALEYCQKALKIKLRTSGEDDPEIADCYNNIGAILLEKCDFDKALEYCQKALDISLRTLGKDHPGVSALYINIGIIWEEKGDYDRSLEFFEKALTDILLNFGENGLDIASCYNNIGNVWHNKRDYDKALEYHEKALDIRLRMQGEDHPEVASCYEIIGNIWADKGDRNRALEYHEKVLAVRRRMFGEENPDMAMIYSNIGSIWYEEDDYDKALDYFKKGLDIVLRTTGEDHLSAANIYSNIGNALADKGDCDKALEYHEKALDIRLRIQGENHPDVANCYKNISNAWLKKGFPEKVLDYYEKALGIYLHTLSEDYPNAAWCCFIKYLLLTDLDRLDEAEGYRKKAIALVRKKPEDELCKQILDELSKMKRPVAARSGQSGV